MSKIKYSIIIPHKNSFDLLKNLLKTIPTRNDFEIIIVDDSSNFLEMEKLNNYSFSDNTKIFFNSKSEGAGKARNIALDNALGKWILFADADDFFSDNIEILLDKYFEANEDIIYFGTSSIYFDTGILAHRHIRYLNLVVNFLKNKVNEDALRYYFTPPWSKMIRRELIENNNIRFEEILASNDIFFSLKSAFHAKSITATLEILYTITVSQGSLINSFSKNHFEARFNAALRANDFLCSVDKKKYQLSLLYFLAKSYKFGLIYTFKVIKQLIEHRSNMFIGLNKIFYIKKVLKERENKKYLSRN